MFKFYISFLIILILSSKVYSANINVSNQEGSETFIIASVYESIEKESSQTKIYSSTCPIFIIHPEEEDRLPYVESSFVYGSANPQGILSINNKIIPIHPGGGFLTMVDYSTGTFTIQAQLQLPTTTFYLNRKVFVNPPLTTSPKKPLTIEYIKPDEYMEVMAGDKIYIECKGSPDSKAYFKITGVKKKFPLREIKSNIGGIYRGTYIVQPQDDFKKSRILVTLESKRKRRKKSCYAKARISRLRKHTIKVVEVINPDTILRAGTSISSYNRAGYMLFLSKGMYLEVIGRIGNEFKVRLSETRTGWVSINDVKVLPRGTAPSYSYVNAIKVIDKYPSAEVRAVLDERIPFEVKPSLDLTWIDVSFFGAFSNTDWINYISSTTIVNQIQWFQNESDLYQLRIHLNPKSWWGYDARYENNVFVLELRGPKYNQNSIITLKDLTIAVDAGHSPDNGAVGPTGSLEKDVNMAIALKLEKKLLKEKAKVIMIRRGDQEVGLYERPKIAWKSKADILISIHNNSLPEGENPFERNGYGMYYYHPHSFALADEILKAYNEVLKKRGFLLRNDGLHYGNLALTRPTQMPSVLTESAYMIVPEEEALLKTEKFQSACAEAIFTGIKKYIQSIQLGK